MTQRDLIIQAVLLVAIVAVTFLLVSFRPVKYTPFSILVANTGSAPATAVDTPIGAREPIKPRYDVVSKVNPFRTIVTPPTPPPPTPTPVPTPPPLRNALSPLKVQFVNPGNVEYVDQTNNLVTWKSGETKKFLVGNQELLVTLKSIDENFTALFTAPPVQEATYGFFDGWKFKP